MSVHKGLPNRSDKLRMSMDVRYQLVGEPFNIDNIPLLLKHGARGDVILAFIGFLQNVVAFVICQLGCRHIRQEHCSVTRRNGPIGDESSISG